MSRFCASLGSVSSGTLRSEDLIPRFCAVLLSLSKAESVSSDPDEMRIEDNETLVSEIRQHMEDDTYFDSEQPHWDLESLESALNSYALPGAHFGANEGDGADFGFWNCDEFCTEDEADDYT